MHDCSGGGSWDALQMKSTQHRTVCASHDRTATSSLEFQVRQHCKVAPARPVYVSPRARQMLSYRRR